MALCYETTDPAGNYATIVLAGILNNGEYSPPQLIKMSFLNRVNSETIAQLFLNSLKIIYKDDIQYNQNLVNDHRRRTLYEKSLQKTFYIIPQMLYVNWFSHNIHAACKHLEKSHQLQINSLITSKRYSKRVLYVREFSKI